MYQAIQDEDNNTVAIKRVDDGAFIPITAENADYQAYLAWAAAGIDVEHVSL